MQQLMHTKKFGVKDLLHAKPAHLKHLMQHKSLPVVTRDLAHMQMIAAPVLSGMKRGAEGAIARDQME
jgi:hypothetical protein